MTHQTASGKRIAPPGHRWEVEVLELVDAPPADHTWFPPLLRWTVATEPAPPLTPRGSSTNPAAGDLT